MITVRYDPRRFRLLIRGHAGAAPYGQDLVCAAASVLALTLAEHVKRLREEGSAADTRICLTGGSAAIACTPNPGHGKEVKQVFRTVCTGFEVLQRLYPEYIRFVRDVL